MSNRDFSFTDYEGKVKFTLCDEEYLQPAGQGMVNDPAFVFNFDGEKGRRVSVASKVKGQPATVKKVDFPDAVGRITRVSYTDIDGITFEGKVDELDGKRVSDYHVHGLVRESPEGGGQGTFNIYRVEGGKMKGEITLTGPLVFEDDPSSEINTQGNSGN